MVQGYYRFPTIHADGTLVFTSESDLWTVGLHSSSSAASQPLVATRLTRSVGSVNTLRELRCDSAHMCRNTPQNNSPAAGRPAPPAL